jgi:23S rRNA (adenine2030-N6)-methyltransferase
MPAAAFTIFAAKKRCARAKRQAASAGSPVWTAARRRSRPISNWRARRGPIPVRLAIEKHPADAAALAIALKPFRRARAENADGYARLLALLPPPERRAAILIDPPYESADEFAEAARALANALRRFATGIYLVWFPIKSSGEADSFCGEVLAAGARKALRLDVMLGTRREDRLTAAGLVVVNPPFGFEDEMRAALALALPLMGAEARFLWLAGGD